MIMDRTFVESVPVDRDEEFMDRVYAEIDKAADEELDRLHREDGIVPTCGKGCYHCCNQHILTSPLEAHKLARHIRREFSEQQITELRIRTRKWHAWDGRMPGRYPLGNPDSAVDLTDYQHRCPMNVDGACIAYQARPMICRIHYVSSPVLACRTLNDRTLSNTVPVPMASIKTVTQPFSSAVKDRIERSGVDFCRSLMPLPHWLAEKMDWDFS